MVGSPDCRHSLLPKSGFTAVGLVDRSIHQLSSRHTIPVRFNFQFGPARDRELAPALSVAFLFGEKRIGPSSVTTVPLPSALADSTRQFDRGSLDCLLCCDFSFILPPKRDFALDQYRDGSKLLPSKDKQNPVRGGNSLWEARKLASATALSSRKRRPWVHAKQPKKFLGSLRLWILR